MKKIGAIILVAVMTAACNPLSLLNISYEDFDLEGQFWAVSGMTARRAHVWLSNGKALVYKVTDPRNDSSAEARIITPSSGAKYFLRPVLK